MAQKKQPLLPVVPVPVLASGRESLVSEWHDPELNAVLAETPRWMRLDLQFDRTAYPYLARKLANNPLNDIMPLLCTILLMDHDVFEAVPSTLENAATNDVIQRGALVTLRQRQKNLSVWMDNIHDRIAALEAAELPPKESLPLTQEEKPLSSPRERLRRALMKDPKVRARIFGDENKGEDGANHPLSATDKIPAVSTSSDTGAPVSGTSSKHPESTDPDQ